MHVPEPGVQTVRSYGLYASTKQESLNLARAQLGQPPVEPPPFLAWQRYLAKIDPQWTAPVCSVCGRPIAQQVAWQPTTGPPAPSQRQGRRH